MYHVVAATTNPAKIKAISLAFDDVLVPTSIALKALKLIVESPNNPLEITKREPAHATE